jgi:hypothetical protein
VGSNLKIEVEEDERQVILMALAHLAVERPGWRNMLEQVALKMDNQVESAPELFTAFWTLRHERVRDSLPENPTPESLNRALAKFDAVVIK